MWTRWPPASCSTSCWRTLECPPCRSTTGPGFTFKQDGPLDLRLDPTSGVTAAERLRQLDQEELENLLAENSDEPYADRIAKAVIQVFRRGGTVDTTRQLYASLRGRCLSSPPGSGRRR